MHHAAGSLVRLVSWPIMAMAFHKDGRPRKLTRRSLFDRDGLPRRAWRRWLSPLPGALVIEPLQAPDGRPTILVISHGTDAPMPGWNLVRQLSTRYNVVSVLMGGGAPDSELRPAAAAFVTLRPEHWNLERIAERLAAIYAPRYAIASGVEACSMTRPLALAGISSVALVHEFASGSGSLGPLDQACDWASQLVFSDDGVARASFDALPRLRNRQALHVLTDPLSTPSDAVDTGLGQPMFDMASHAAHLDRLGCDADRREQANLLASFGVLQPSLLPFGDDAPTSQIVLARVWLLNWSLWNGLSQRDGRPHLRRPCLGFHPQVYALAHMEALADDRLDPLSHWLAGGRPDGPWTRKVFQPTLSKPGSGAGLRIALHGHFHFPEFAGDLVARLQRNRTRTDLFLTTDSAEKAASLHAAVAAYGGAVRIEVVPNRGRDIGPFLTALRDDLRHGGYDVFGHVHGKKSVHAQAGIGDRWRDFLWDRLIGGDHPMLDVAVAALAADPSLGLLIADDPHLTGWDDNRRIAEGLAARMGITPPLPNFFDFPIGTMFWTRPAALMPLIDLDLRWDDYPAEPVPLDGTILHALERLVPFAAAKAGFEMASLHVPGPDW